jgi:hypothetical protein
MSRVILQDESVRVGVVCEHQKRQHWFQIVLRDHGNNGDQSISQGGRIKSLLKSRAASNAPFFVYIMCFGGKEREGKGENKGILNLEGVSNSSEVSQDRVSSNHLV